MFIRNSSTGECHNHNSQPTPNLKTTKSNASRLMTKPTNWSVRPAKTPISLGNRPVWSVFAVRSMGSWGFNIYSCDSEDTDRTGRMSRLIWIFAGRKGHFDAFVMRRVKHATAREAYRLVLPSLDELITVLSRTRRHENKKQGELRLSRLFSKCSKFWDKKTS